MCIDAISHLSTGDRNDKLRLRDRLTLLLCCNCICRKEVQHYGILVQSPTLSDFFVLDILLKDGLPPFSRQQILKTLNEK